MTATPEKYLAPFSSQRWMKLPLNGCRAASGVHLRCFETLGEQVTWPNGSAYQKAARTKLMQAYRLHMADARGEKWNVALGFNRDQSLHAYRTMWPDGNPQASNPTKEELREGLKAGYAYSLSGDVRDIPDPNPIDNAVNETAHEIAVGPAQRADGKWPVYEPMNSRIVWATFAQVWAFTKRFRTNGKALAIRVKTGWATEVAKANRDCKARKAVLREQRDRAEKEAAAAELVIEQMALEQQELERRIEELENRPTCEQQIADAYEDGVRAAAEAADEAIMALVED